MGSGIEKKPVKRTVVGILAHVDAGKTTLSEAMLYLSGVIRSQGRVDHGDTFLDTFSLERRRGITIFSKQAVLTIGDTQVTILDTPGHVDFSPEAERTLDVLDCAVLVVSAPEGIQSHMVTLWRLLRRRNIPTFVFVNKMDMPGTSRETALTQLSSEFGGIFFDYESPDYEAVAMGGEQLLENYLETGRLSERDLQEAAERCEIFPCFFGAALRLEGVEAFMKHLAALAPACAPRREFGARVYKITHDAQGAKITHMKITGGALKPRDVLRGEGWEYKVTALRRMNGAKTSPLSEALPGDVAAISGLEAAYPGMGLGFEKRGEPPVIEPVLHYSVLFPEGTDLREAVRALRKLAEEEPALQIRYDERTGSVAARLMGQVQLEVLKELLRERYGLEASFGPGRILYKETISTSSEGVGHYEPLRHYAEVHLLLEPGEPGSGVQVGSVCPEDELDRNWQRLILTHLLEKQHLGVLTGSPVTDIKITLTAGKAHLKHTEGGDFREATYRAVRQGLMGAASVILEPWYDFRLEVPAEAIGRAMNDLQRMGARVPEPETLENGMTRLSGSAPVKGLRDYASELAVYTRGRGRLGLAPCGFRPCADAETVIQEAAYNPEADLKNSPDSVFCSHGAGFIVKWYDVPNYMHLESAARKEKREAQEEAARRFVSLAATDKELTAIFEKTYGPIKRQALNQPAPRKKPVPAPQKGKASRPKTDGQEFVLVDGYNIIFAWPELKELAGQSLEMARDRLINILRNYQGFRQCALILVFDAHKVKGGQRSIEKTGDFSVVYTKEAETADMYIERTTYDLSKKHFVRVATSDGLEQIIILGNGALRVPAGAFESEVREVERSIRAILQNGR